MKVKFYIKKFLLLAILLNLVFFASFLITNKIEADSNDYTINLNISSDGNIKGSIIINLKNTDNNNIINGYQLNLPFKADSITDIKLNDQSVNNTLNIDELTHISINFLNKALKPGSTAKITLNFTASNIVKKKLGVTQLYIPSSKVNYTSNIINYHISYPKSFGTPLFTSTIQTLNVNTNNDLNDLLIQTDKGLYFMWGDSITIDVKSNYKLQNNSDKIVTSLNPLFYEDNIQSVIYSTITNSQFGLIDKLNNQYSSLELKNREVTDFTLVSRVKITNEVRKDPYPADYKWSFNKNFPLTQELLNIVNNKKENLEKMREANTFFVKKTIPFLVEKVDLSNLNDIWKRFNSSSALNSFEYCYMMVSLANNLGLKARIDYGYLIGPDISILKINKPHVWCDFQDNQKDILIDPFLESTLQINYFAQAPVDRILVGIWDPTQNYNNMMGLIGNNNDLPEISIIDLGNFKDSQSEVSSILELPSNGFAGEYYSGKLTIKNNTNHILLFKNLNLNDHDILFNLNYDQFTKSLLPGQDNILLLNNLRENNFLYDGSKSVELKGNVYYQNNNYTIYSNTNLNFTPDRKIFITILVILISIIVILIFILLKLFKTKKTKVVNYLYN